LAAWKRAGPVYPQIMTARAGSSAFAALPGEELVHQGIADLERGVESVESLLVSMGAPRLTRLGFRIDSPIPSPEHRLYEVLRAEDPDAAHSSYNSLVRRLVSFERAAECAS
jgi:hypothetical protein